MNSRRLKALFRKEFFQIIRDPSTLLISVVLPLLLLFLYGYGVSLDLDHLRIGLVMEDTSPDARSLAESFTDSPYFDVKVVRDRRELYGDLEKGSIRGFVVIPSYFSDFLNQKNKIAPIQVIADGSETNTANFVQYYAQGAYQNWQQQKWINVEPHVWYNEELESRYFLLSGSLAITMTLIGTLLTALVISREWERGTMESMLATSMQVGEMVLGKALPYFLLGLISMAICTVTAICFFGLPFRGSYLALLFVSSAFLFCACGLGLMISTLSKQQSLSYQIAIVSGFLPAYILSGFLFEIASMPLWIQWITYLIPARYFVQSLQTLFLVGNVWSLLLWNVLPMFVIGVFFFFVTVHKSAKGLD